MARSKAQQVSAKPGSVTLEGVDENGNETEVEWQIHPLDGDAFLELESMPENAAKERLEHLLYETLKQDDPNLEKEDVLDMEFVFLEKILEEIAEVNGIEDFSDEEALKQAMENRQ